MARLRYASDVRPVAVKLSAWKGSVAHPEHDRARSRVRGSTKMLVDGHSGHGGVNHVGDGGAPVAAVDKRSNQPVIEHHGNKAKLPVCSARAGTDHGAPATARRTRR